MNLPIMNDRIAGICVKYQVLIYYRTQNSSSRWRIMGLNFLVIEKYHIYFRPLPKSLSKGEGLCRIQLKIDTLLTFQLPKIKHSTLYGA